jgi:cytochrome oxidase assembly protein ShyY1
VSAFKFLLTPRWIAITLVCIFMLPAFQALSNWQWHRLQDRQVANAAIQAQINKDPILITDLLTTKVGEKTVPDDSQWRTVGMSGVWLQDNQVLVRKKSLESDLGLWVVTPLQLPDGTIVMVNRGWTAAANSAVDSPVVANVPTGTIEVLGRLRVIQERSKPAPTDLPDGQVDRIVPIEIINSSETLSNAYVEMTASRPESLTTEIRPLPAPEVTEGAHRSYAIQWIFFEIMTVIGWVILVRNEVKDQRKTVVS